MSSRKTARRAWWRPEVAAAGAALVLGAASASALEYREDFDAPGKPEPPAGLAWSYRAELCPVKTWNAIVPGDGYAYLSVKREWLEPRKANATVWPFQTLMVGPVGPGHRLLPAGRVIPMNYAPRAPERPVSGRIVSVYRGVSQAGRNSVVALNLGRRQGIEEGHVVGIRERARAARDPDSRTMIELPGETTGEVLVFRVFDTISYGLIVAARKAVAVGDDIVNP